MAVPIEREREIRVGSGRRADFQYKKTSREFFQIYRARFVGYPRGGARVFSLPFLIVSIHNIYIF